MATDISSALSATTPSPSQPATRLAPPPSSNPASSSSSSLSSFAFPAHHSFPPFFTLQPNLTTLARQLALWSALLQSYCAHQRIFRLNLSDAASGPVFNNARISRRLDLLSIRKVVDYMVSAEGDRRAEWDFGSANGRRVKDGPEQSKNVAWIFWRRPEEWADLIYGWVDGTGQKGSVLTVYELREGEETARQEWVGMDEVMFRRCIDVLVKRGRAQVFGDEEGAGIKIF